MKTRSISICFAFCVALVCAALMPPGFAQQMNYQGRLTDSSGNALLDGQYTLAFELYDAATAGARVWGPFVYDGGPGDGHGPKADLVNGRFNVILGPNDIAGSPISGSFVGGPRYLQITVANNPPLSPRQQILSAPESLHAINADHATIADGIKGSLNVTADFQVGGNSTFSGKLDVAGTARFDDYINFGQSTGQKVNLWLDAYSIGVQNSTLYQRSGDFFAWYKGGTHADDAFNPGGGTSLMTLSTVGLGVPSAIYTPQIGINRTSVRGALDVTSGGIWRSLTVGGNGGTDVVVAGNMNGVATIGAHIGTMDGWANLCLNPGGFVGIGTSTPAYPLQVNGSNIKSAAYYGFFYPRENDYVGYATDQRALSILAEHGVGGEFFLAYSDRRIKEDLKLSDTANDLEVIQKLRVTDYRHIDRVTKGDILRKGFIAQEVQTVIPEAVEQSADYIPNIYSIPSKLVFDETLKSLTVTMSKPHGLKVSDRVRIFADESKLELTVSAVISDLVFVVAHCELAPKRAFIYGKYVTDFLSVDYDRVFTTGIGAIQELARKIDDLKKAQERIVQLERKAAQIDALHAEVAELKEMVTKLAQLQRDQPSKARFGAATEIATVLK